MEMWSGEEIVHQPMYKEFFLLLRDDTTVILAQTRLGILQGNCVISSIKVT